MSEYNLRELVISGHAPKNVRMLMARGAAPLQAEEMLELLVHLRNDPDGEVAGQAGETLDSWNGAEVLALLRSKDCPAAVLDYFADPARPEEFLQTIIANPATSGEAVTRLALGVSPLLLDAILDNRTRILEYPAILEGIRRNPAATPRTLGVVEEIETEFLGEKRKDYSIESTEDAEDAPGPADAGAAAVDEELLDIEAEIAMLLASPPPDDIELSLEGLPIETEDNDANLASRIATMPVKEKIKYALFGTREVRAMLVRDTNREVARSVLRSPKLRENEVEGFAAMRNVSDHVLREIGNSREWLKNTFIVHNLVKNPKTPTVISMRLMPRLRTHDLMLMSRDRSLPDATRIAATRLMKQRLAKGSSK
ncbi:MAG: hypothetical protein LBT74_04025 [Acidobacteriota bacterium]|jgi:hypothetical protein|nr:hypothetical protein [Acidobacteriota bacterium]